MNEAMRVFAEITKVDEEKRMVYGYASTIALDSQGERVSKAALEEALPDYMRFANVREMHQPSAVGVAKEAEVDDTGLYLAAKVVDDTAWLKVKEGVYKGFSIGGKKLAKTEDLITSLRLTEISLVDRPANPECVFDVFKAEEGGTQGDDTVAKVDPDPLPPEIDVATDLTKFLGDAAWDAALAISALNAIYGLLSKEMGEGNPDQLSALQAVVDGLKAFIASEIMEPDTDDDTVAMGDTGGDLVKADKTTLRKVQGIHDHAVGLGAKCSGSQKMEEGDDMTKLEELQDKLQKVEGEKADLQKRVEELEAKPAPAKAVITSVSKEADGVAQPKMEPIRKADGTIDEQATALQLTKQALGQPIAYTPGGMI
jgi:phage head maturation protease